MPDDFGVYDGMKVWEFLDFFAVAYKIGHPAAQASHHGCAPNCSTWHFHAMIVNGLSRGMKQRLCLAKTLVHDPPVLILDRMFSGLRSQSAHRSQSTAQGTTPHG
ncbi:MAG: ATP-binding cassette domain-containing protein [Pirellulaceae bacterium]